jgi:DNA-binding response OmpR family regulator
MFDGGADEYFPFPPDPALFLARARNLLARSGSRPAGAAKPSEYSFGPLRISPEARTASVAGADAGLTALEFDILLFFLRNRGRVVSRFVLLERVWKLGMEAGPRAVDKRIEALRRKLGRFGKKIVTVFGIGYMLKI